MEYKYNRVCIFDGSFALHRNLSEPHNYEMRNTEGKKTGGIYGVLRTILKELRTYNYFPVVIFDGGLSERRLSIYPNYKKAIDKQMLLESKTKTEENILDEAFRIEYNTQRDDLENILPLFGIPVINIPQWEGDDLIYVLSKLCRDSIVVSDDKDLIQLIKEPDAQDPRRCRVRRPMRDELADMQYLTDRGLDVNEYIGCKAIIGDPSDNIPSSCFQVGEKTAIGLYKLYETLTADNIPFPEDEETLAVLCKKFNIPKRQAYLNFNENQYLSNLLLTDLSLVDSEVSDELIEYIEADIHESAFKSKDKNMIWNIMKYLDIKTLSVDELLQRVEYLLQVLMMEDASSCTITDINISHGRLF